MRLATALLALVLTAPLVVAQTPGSCQPGTAEADLTISDVDARVFTGGNLFFGNTTVSGDGYLVPKASGHSPIFAAGIWVGGFIGGDLRVAGATYNDFEFWPGPLEDGATLPDPDDCSPFDKIWVVDAYDLALYEASGEAIGDLATWPVDLGAPVTDGDGVEGNYNLEGGDRPTVLGHQTAFWVMNDVGNVHESYGTDPIGLEVRVSAFSTVEAALDQQTFYRYELVNRNAEPIEGARVSFWFDPDLGDASDDYVGSDSTRGMAFVYNDDGEDGIYGTPPAAGFDLLGGAGSTRWPAKSRPAGTTGQPQTPEQFYHAMSGLWNDGTPITEGGDGYQTGGPIVEWSWPGDPVTEAFWSEVNFDGQGGVYPAGDRQHILNAPGFTLAPGESRTFDLAILFAQGTDNLDSVEELQAVSDFVQARYDAGDLFVPSPLTFPPAGTLAAPDLLAPEDGAFFVGETTLSWTPVPGAEYYAVQFSDTPDFFDYTTLGAAGPEVIVGGTANEVDTTYWRVQAIAGVEQSLFSEARSYTSYDFVPEGILAERIVETAYPGVEDVCADAPDDPGCAEVGGNTVWLDPNSTADYLVTAPNNSLGFGGLVRFFDVIEEQDYELRFTDACATPGACLGVYALGDGEITSVPFELWNTGPGLGADDDPADDVRMIPFILNTGDGDLFADWADTFTDTQEIDLDGEMVEVPIAQRVYWMEPDRPNGYALFEQAANDAGGAGASYPVENDPDTQIDINPASGEPCENQGLFVDFCYRGGGSFVYPIGRMLVADLAEDGTTPPAGTTVRFVTNDRLFVGAEDEAPTQPEAFALTAAYPNPFGPSTSGATVEYRLGAAADVRLSVFDVLGRRVAVLAEGSQPAGAHRAIFESAGLASGVYLVVLKADGRRTSRKVMLVR